MLLTFKRHLTPHVSHKNVKHVRVTPGQSFEAPIVEPGTDNYLCLVVQMHADMKQKNVSI